MIQRFLFLILLLGSSTLYAQEVNLQGKITNYSGKDSLKLLIYSSNTPVDISIPVSTQGEFSKTLTVAFASYAKLFFNPNDFILLILSPKEKITVTANFTNMASDNVIKGSKHTQLWNSNNAALLQFSKNTQDLQSKYERAIDSVEKQRIDYVISFVKQNPTSLASLAVIEVLDISMHSHIYEFLDSSLMTVHKGNPIVENFHTNLKQALFLKEGSVAPDIVLLDETGKQVALSSLKGKVVLIDFWASWCRPCRQEIPNLKQAHARYSSRGFEIYSVSIDNDKNAWLQALSQENMPWITVYDAQKTYSSLYNVTSIPNTLLIGKDGKIISKNLRGAALEEQLQILLGM
ncbi:MAG: Thiol-disulfide oxidoreductase ResA [Bacteroidetes bacterium ADurb.Bin217]|nr:MAG: Thiol-disulfide oxidoreductase ResA [Bacteroidetes bacterium ADurb.Bin217]